MMRITPLLAGLCLLARCAAIVAHRRVALCFGLIVVCFHTILLGTLFVPCGIIVAAADNDLGHCRGCCKKCSQTNSVSLFHHGLLYVIIDPPASRARLAPGVFAGA